MPQISAHLPQLVPPAEPSHAADLCAGFVVWHIVWHRGTDDTVHRYETCARARNYHGTSKSRESRHNPLQSIAHGFSRSPIDNAGDENRL
jgi:hypothetical protein